MHGLPRRTWPVPVPAFTTLVGLAAFSGLSTLHQSRSLNEKVWQLKRAHERYDRLLQFIRSEVQLSGLTLRDYLLNPSPEAGGVYKEQLRDYRSTILNAVEELSRLAPQESSRAVQQLQREIEASWQAADPVFTWSIEEKQARSYRFLRENVVGRRQAALALTHEIQKLIEENLATQERQLAGTMAGFDTYLIRITVAGVLISAAIAFAGGWRISRLEKLATAQHRATLADKEELQRLSRQLVSAQEEERRALSRELHDEVGQMLTGLRIELGTIQKLHCAPKEIFDGRMEQTRVLLDQIMVAVRDLAMGLRPSLLDDLGLGPALNWQAREFARRYDIPVTVRIESDLSRLSETQRTAIYRVVQEALTNCARHARAKSIEVRLAERDGKLQVAVEDDGIGYMHQSNGLGLLGMKERVRSLGGSFEVGQRYPHGTVVSAMIPLLEAHAHA